MTVHGKDTYFAVEDSAATTLRDLSEFLTSVQFGRQNDTHDSTTFGNTGHKFVAGLTNGTIQLAGFYDRTATTGATTVLDSLLGLGNTEVAWEYGPEGNAAGRPKYSGNAVLSNHDSSSPVADLVTFSATLQISGAVTEGVFS